MVEGSRCFASTRCGSSRASGEHRVVKHDKAMYFSLLFQSYWLSFSQRKVASFFSYFSQDILKVCFSKIFQDFSISSRIFRNLSFAKEGDLLFLLLPRSSKVCLFQDVPKFSKTFQNFPKGCFSQNLLRVFNLFTSTISQSFF